MNVDDQETIPQSLPNVTNVTGVTLCRGANQRRGKSGDIKGGCRHDRLWTKREKFA